MPEVDTDYFRSTEERHLDFPLFLTCLCRVYSEWREGEEGNLGDYQSRLLRKYMAEFHLKNMEQLTKRPL